MHPYETLFIIQKLEERLIADGRLAELAEQDTIPPEDIKTVERWVRGQCFLLEKSRPQTSQKNKQLYNEMVLAHNDFKSAMNALSTPTSSYYHNTENSWKRRTIRYPVTLQHVCYVWDTHEIFKLHTLSCVDELLNPNRKEAFINFSRDCIHDDDQEELMKIICTFKIHQLDTLVARYLPTETLTSGESKLKLLDLHIH